MAERHGWGDLVDIEENANAEDTDPDLKPVRADEDSRPRPAKGEAKSVKTKPAKETSRPLKVPKDEPPVAPSPAPSKGLSLKLPPVDGGQAASAPTTPARPQPARPISNPPDNSPFGELGKEPAAKQVEAPKAKSLSEYREVLGTIAVAIVLLVCAVIYQSLTKAPPPQEPVLIQPKPPEPAKVVKTDPPPNNPAQNPIEPTENPEEEPVVAQEDPVAAQEEATGDPGQPAAPATRMVSILSTPPGATIEVNGAAWGLTPLVRTTAGSETAIEVSLTLKGFKVWHDVVNPDESGHFTIEVTLEKL